MFEDTIIAVSTPPGKGGLGIVRLSGRRALAVARRMFRAGRGPGAPAPVRELVFGRLYDFERKKAIDEAFLTYFKAPHSYTREDVVEISCHGSPLTLEAAVHLGVKAGARAAHPGEFTLRAYRNGRIDILQAEAVNDLIRAVSPVQADISYRQLKGSLSKTVFGIRKKIVRLAAQVEAAIEFPEEKLGISGRRHAGALDRLAGDLERLVSSFERGKALREGLTLAIVGRTNVGKSTLFNALLEEDRAIVTPHAGTTRDYLKEKVVIGDSLFKLVDMAGLGTAAHPVEREGMSKGRRMAAEADGLLFVVDGSKRESGEDGRLLGQFKEQRAILVENKADLPRKLRLETLLARRKNLPVLRISALKGTGLKDLKDKIHEIFVPSGKSGEETILHARQRDILAGIRDALRNASRLLEEGHSEEVVAEEIRAAIPLIGRLTGEIPADEVMEDVFRRFCVGK